MTQPTWQTDILILGAGIGGYETFRTLARLLKRAGLSQKITIVDQNNYFTFTPMLHEVASGAIEPSHCTVPLRELTYKTPHTFLKTRVIEVRPAEKIVITESGTVAYNYVVIALGSGVNYFNTPGAAEYSYTVRTLPGAMRLRQNLITAFEHAEGPITINVVGGGYTGIETAGQLQYLIKHDLTKLYPKQQTVLRVIEAGPTILSVLPEKVQTKIKRHLIREGIELSLARPVKSVGPTSIMFGDGQELASDFTVWCAGIKNQADMYLSAPYQENGRILVNEFLHSAIDPTLYAVGDIAHFCNQGSTLPAPQLGEVAHKEGGYIAEHIIASIQKKKCRPFSFTSRGMLIPVGDWYGVMVMGSIILFGPVAWWIRRTAYLLFMPGLLRKLKIVVDWTLHSLSFRYIIDIENEKRKTKNS
jgi:NADH dehydrogenase